MGRLIFYLILLAIIGWVVKRAFFPAPGKVDKIKETAEELVQDPACQCYIPKSQSYTVSLEGKKMFFCSEECYRKYLASKVLPKN